MLMMARLFFVVAGLYDAVWFLLMLLAPERVMVAMPPSMVPTLVLLAGVALLCFANAIRVRRPLVLLCMLAKISGPVLFVVAVQRGYLAGSQWWMPVVNDVIWIPPLVAILRRPPGKRRSRDRTGSRLRPGTLHPLAPPAQNVAVFTDALRPHLVRGAALKHLAAGISALRYVHVYSRWSGSLDAGTYAYDNGSGDLLGLAWRPDGLVGITFDHESDRSPHALPEVDEAAYDPRRHLAGFPDALSDLLDAAHSAMQHTRDLLCDDFGITAGFWTIDDRVTLAEPANLAVDHGLWMVEPLAATPDVAMGDRTRGLEHRHSLSPAQSRLALDLLPALGASPLTFSPEQLTALRQTYDGEPSPDSEQSARRLLGMLDIRW